MEKFDELDAVAGNKGETFTKTPIVPIANETESNSGQGKIAAEHLNQAEYPISSGIAVVINNINFDDRLNLTDRIGSDLDASSLFQRFMELGFDSDLLNDATKNEMETKFNEIKGDKESLKITDCLIVVLLTHGTEDSVYMTDGVVKIKNVMEHFNATNCPELHLKPKVFILQACRGSDLGGGVERKVIRNRDPNQADASASYVEYDEEFGETIRIPNEADFLAVYSTSTGYGSFRNTETGSPFVRHLSDELREMKKGEDFYKVLTRVNKKVGMGYKPKHKSEGVITQMPCFISHLTKDLVFKQKV
ncbi:caspase 3 [Mytilus galloprovincialis]|uniref:Caspase 3 n=1 Tax=Mytilus galloprovincialis TaxID=29158 RepID=A0A8B6H7Q5_MYTGA|nr:caspase 3 [Mytilus galloprovincialis]